MDRENIFSVEGNNVITFKSDENLDPFIDFIYPSHDEKEVFVTSKNNLKSIVSSLFHLGLIQVDIPLSVWKLYEMVYSCVEYFSENGKEVISFDDANEYFSFSIKVNEIIEKENPFISLGGVFSLPNYKVDFLMEISDSQRIRTGPATMDGMFPCPKCNAPKENTTSDQVQTRRADEPIPFKNTCLECNHRWSVG